MNVVAIVQARMSSSRLPGKVLADIAGRTMLARVVGRLLESRRLDAVIVATSTMTADDPIIDEAARLGVASFRGSLDDVLARYVGAARRSCADAVVRVTADCPLIDSVVVDQTVEALTTTVDYASNTQQRSFPRGLDCEALHVDTLERLDRLACVRGHREHVTAFVTEHPELFRIAHVLAASDASDLRWTVDTAQDLALVRELYHRFAPAEPPAAAALIEFCRAHPEVTALNAHILQRPIHVA